MFSSKKLNRVKLYEYQEKLNELETFAQFASLQAIAWDEGYDLEFECAIDICGTAPIRATMRNWLDGSVFTESVPQPRYEHVNPREVRRLRNLAKNT